MFGSGQSHVQQDRTMKHWTVQDAQARFDELLDSCQSEGPQLVTRRDAAVAALVSIEHWRGLQGQDCPSLKALLLSDDARAEFKVSVRGRARRSPPMVAD
jgi:prevent-host-death family protein